MSRQKKDPLIKILTRPDHIFEEAYPYYQGALKQYTVLMMYQERVNTRKLNLIDPAQIRGCSLYYNDLQDAFSAVEEAQKEHGCRLLFFSVYYLQMGINAAFWKNITHKYHEKQSSISPE